MITCLYGMYMYMYMYSEHGAKPGQASCKCREGSCSLPHLPNAIILLTCCPAVEVHPQYPNTQLREVCESMGIAVVAYASLGCGQLLQHPVVVDIAKETGKTAAQVRFRSVNWCFGFAS